MFALMTIEFEDFQWIAIIRSSRTAGDRKKSSELWLSRWFSFSRLAQYKQNLCKWAIWLFIHLLFIYVLIPNEFFIFFPSDFSSTLKLSGHFQFVDDSRWTYLLPCSRLSHGLILWFIFENVKQNDENLDIKFF